MMNTHMTLAEAIEARHSVRKYIRKPLSADIIQTLQKEIGECNKLGHLNIQLITNEPKAFSGMMSYGVFTGVENYLVMAGMKSDDLDERIGYYGERLVLLAQQIGLNTCWVGLTYNKVKKAYNLHSDDKIACVIALGYGESQGPNHKKRKTENEVTKGSKNAPQWFHDGVKAALLAPTAVHQQKFTFEYISPSGNELPKVKATRGFSMIGYTQMDLGIAKLHFEIGAGKENFEWA